MGLKLKARGRGLLVSIACAWSACAAAARMGAGSAGPAFMLALDEASQHAFVSLQPDGSFAVHQGAPPQDAAAWASYTPQQATRSNFGRLRVDSSGHFPDEVQMRAMGFLEGWLTAVPIYQHWSNMQWYLATNTNHSDKVINWLSVQQQWMSKQIAAHAGSSDPFWVAQTLIWQQLEGMAAGYAARLAAQPQLAAHLKPLGLSDLMLLNTFGDMDDLLVMAEQPWFTTQLGSAGPGPASAPGRGAARLHPKWQQITPGQARAHIAKSGHCSALIKVTSDLSDLLLGHTTWWSYASLLRLYKHYHTQLAHPAIAAQQLSFSSYPGLVTSMDDFLISSAGLVLLETSNDVYNLDLYLLSSNKAALSWQRTRAACMLSADGATWAKYIQTANSGTYNNQYMVVDLKRFIPAQELQPGLLTVIEMLPGGAYVADTTEQLERGYWPSYNIPYFPEVYNKTGTPDLQAALRQRGHEFEPIAEGLSYQVSSRAKIFRRDSGQVDSLADLKWLLRSNGWSADAKARDPFSPSPWEAICARGDLDPEAPDASGCYDAKVTSYKMALKMQAEVINGPAWAGEGTQGSDFPAFSWRKWKDVAHEGMVHEYRTVFELQAP